VSDYKNKQKKKKIRKRHLYLIKNYLHLSVNVSGFVTIKQQGKGGFFSQKKGKKIFQLYIVILFFLHVISHGYVNSF